MNTPTLNRDGCCQLAAEIVEQCLAVGTVEDAINRDEPTPLDVALTWAVWCGQDPREVAPALVKRAREAAQTEPEPSDPRRRPSTEHDRIRDAEYHRLKRYSDGKRCPHPGCGTIITNGARTCVHHRWYK